MAEAVAKKSHLWERDEYDWYVEPSSATEALLTVERFVGNIHDPCCGQGNIVNTLIGGGYEATGSDMVRRTDADWFTGLFADHPPHRVWIITPRVSCPPGSYLAAGNKAGNGSSDWCWLVWDKSVPFSGTELSWLRRRT